MNSSVLSDEDMYEEYYNTHIKKIRQVCSLNRVITFEDYKRMRLGLPLQEKVKMVSGREITRDIKEILS